MNIDLLFTQKGEAGLIANENFVKKITGAVFDAKNGIFTLEFTDMDYMDLNIPIESEYNQYLDASPLIHIGAVKDGQIGQAYQVPLLLSDDPYRNEMMKPEEVENPIAAFGYFIKHCIAGQPAHRDDVEDEASAGCILGDSSPSSLQFAPQLARRQTLESRPVAAPSLSAPGLGGGGTSSSGGSYRSGGTQSGSNDDSGKKK